MMFNCFPDADARVGAGLAIPLVVVQRSEQWQLKPGATGFNPSDGWYFHVLFLENIYSSVLFLYPKSPYWKFCDTEIWTLKWIHITHDWAGGVGALVFNCYMAIEKVIFQFELVADNRIVCGAIESELYICTIVSICNWQMNTHKRYSHTGTLCHNCLKLV